MNTAINYLINSRNISNFKNSLTSSQLRAFQNSSNKSTWTRNFIKRKFNMNNDNVNMTSNIKKTLRFTSFLNKLKNKINKNKNSIWKLNTSHNKTLASVSLKGNRNTVLQLEQVCPTNGSKGIYFLYGHTARNMRRKGYGTQVRALVAGVARNAKLNVYQYSQNTERLVNNKTLPISGQIMKKLGAVEINKVPCRNKQSNFTAFVIRRNVN